jgi:hypothetical protein
LAIDWDGDRALTEQQRCHAEAEFCGTVADGLKSSNTKTRAIRHLNIIL